LKNEYAVRIQQAKIHFSMEMFWKCGTVQIFGNDYNKSKPDSGGT
jgi:hypothetical protein